MIYQEGKYPVHEVILHTSATPGNWHTGKSVQDMVDAIRRWHVVDNGWSDIGYHRVVAPDGSIGIGRSLYKTGAHVRGRNRGTVGICMVPSVTHNGIKTFDTYFTEAQRQAVKAYLKDLMELTEITKVSGHNDYANKECPGFKVHTKDWI